MTVMTFAKGDDWFGVYIDDKLFWENHSLDPYDAVKFALDNQVTAVTNRWVDLDWLYTETSLPNDIADVKWQED